MGGTYFFTVVAFNRAPILTLPENVTKLRDAFRTVMKDHPFVIDAFVLLPDHLHCIWTLPEGDHDFSTRWRLIKSTFTRNCDHDIKPFPGESRKRKNEQAVWQRRFWEHWIRDDTDMIGHVDYIHYNPVKHGLARSPRDWVYSTFRKYMERGIYPEDWGSLDKIEFREGIGAE
jgi:putative transposase